MMRTDKSHMRPPLTLQGSPSGTRSGPPRARTQFHIETHVHTCAFCAEIEMLEEILVAITSNATFRKRNDPMNC